MKMWMLSIASRTFCLQIMLQVANQHPVEIIDANFLGLKLWRIQPRGGCFILISSPFKLIFINA